MKERTSAPTFPVISGDSTLLTTILDLIPGYVYFISSDYQVQYANQIFRERFGDPAGKLCYQILKGRTSPCEECSPFHKLKNNEVQKTFAAHTDGRSYNVYSYPISDKSGVPFILKVGIDCTERLEAEKKLRYSEKRYRYLYERNMAGCFQTTLSGDFLNCNDAYAKTFGYHSAGELKSYGAIELYFNSADRQIFLEQLQQFGKLSGYELHLRKRDGSSVWCLVNVSLVEDEKHPEGIIEGTLIDITPRKLAEQQLKSSHEQLRNLYENLQSVREHEQERIAVEFHDRIGQTLTGLKIDLTWLQNQLSGDHPHLMHKTREMIEQLNKTMQSVREIAAEIKPPILADFGISAAINWFSKEFERKTGIHCDVRCQPGEITLEDSELSTALFRVYQEILTNIIRHAQANQVFVSLLKDPNQIELSVRDNGVGFSADQLNQQKSMGIMGMRGRLLPWNGTVEIRSEPGQGTTVAVKVPLRKKIRVLIADDHAIVRRGLRQILCESPDILVADEAKDGFETIQKVWERSFDVVVLDLSMPGKSGFEVLEQLQHYHPNLPVLILSVHTDQEYAIRALKAGCSGYLTKDTVNEELISAIRQVASGKTFITAALAEKVALKMTRESQANLHHKLSNREFQIMCMIASGKTVKQIAHELSLSASTVSTTRSRMLKKMGMANNAAVTYYAIKNGLVQ